MRSPSSTMSEFNMGINLLTQVLKTRSLILFVLTACFAQVIFTLTKWFIEYRVSKVYIGIFVIELF